MAEEKTASIEIELEDAQLLKLAQPERLKVESKPFVRNSLARCFLDPCLLSSGYKKL